MDSAFAAVGYYTEADGERTVYAIEGDLEFETGTFEYRAYVADSTSPPLQRTTLSIDHQTGRFEADLFGTTMIGAMQGPPGSRIGWLSQASDGTRPDQMNWWVERPALPQSGGAYPAELYQGTMVELDASEPSAGRFFLATLQVDAIGRSAVLHPGTLKSGDESIARSGSLMALGSSGKLAFEHSSGETAWMYTSADNSTVLAVNFSAGGAGDWVSTLKSKASEPDREQRIEQLAGTYKLALVGDRSDYVDHTWMTQSDHGTLTLIEGGSSAGAGVAQFVSDRTGEVYTGNWGLPYRSSGNVGINFEATGPGLPLESFSVALVVGDHRPDVLVGASTVWARDDALPEYQPMQIIATRVGPMPGGGGTGAGPNGASGGEPEGTSEEPPPPPANAEEFIDYFAEEHRQGVAYGNAIVDVLDGALGDAIHERTPWGAENYWFQDQVGSVWSLWHGGIVHILGNGEHQWQLTNLADAAGLTGEIDFETGSMSGVMTRWRAFSIQGIVDGTLVSLWWSPESAVHEWGREANGWVLTPLDTGIFHDPATGEVLESIPRFKTFTETQHNGRYYFNPEPRRTEIEMGMSVVLVDEAGEVYVATFSTPDNPLVAVPGEIANVWLLERFAEVPGVKRAGLTGSTSAFIADYVARSSG